MISATVSKIFLEDDWKSSIAKFDWYLFDYIIGHYFTSIQYTI